MQLPAQPNSWFLVGRAVDLRRGPLAIDLPDRRLVAFRAASGRVAVLDAHCAHLGADLSAGDVIGESLRCPFHSWQYNADGRCVGVPCGELPEFARQRSYPVAVRHGLVFAFPAERPAFPLPFFDGEDPANYVAARPVHFTAECDWTLIAANGFDCQHLAPVHGRELTGGATVDCPHPFARRIRYRTRVTGTTVTDRLLRWLVGHTVAVSITSWAGSLVVVTANFRRTTSRMIFSIRPLEERTQFAMIVFAHRGPLGLVSLPLRRRFSRAFIESDLRKLRGARFNPHSLVPADRLLAEYYDWLLGLGDAPARNGTLPARTTP